MRIVVDASLWRARSASASRGGRWTNDYPSASGFFFVHRCLFYGAVISIPVHYAIAAWCYVRGNAIALEKMVLRYLSSAKLKRSDEHWQNYVSLLHVLSHISCSLQSISLSGMNDATLSRHNLIRLLFQQESSYSPDLLRDAWTTNDRQPPQKIPFALACVHFSSELVKKAC